MGDAARFERWSEARLEGIVVEECGRLGSSIVAEGLDALDEEEVE